MMNIPTSVVICEEFENVRPDVRFPHKKEWDNRFITEADGYQIPSNWSNQELDILLTYLHSSIKTGKISRSGCKIVIAGACYLRKPGGLFADHRLIDSTNFGSMLLDWNPSAVVQLEGLRSSRLPVLSPTDRAYGLFICGFLFKILSKPSQNVIQSWSHVKGRCMNFYPSRETPKEWPKPQLEWLDNLKWQFNNDHRATRTALRFVNNLEMIYTDSEKVESRVIQYLFSMPLSYTGMHAYKLFCDVKEKTGKETVWLLSQLMCPQFQDQLEAIDEINKNWDLGEPNTNPAFRYARLLGSQYFPEIQTKNCLALVYCLARILSHYDSSGSNSNPEQIAGLERISEMEKAKMDRAASLIYQICK